LQRIHLVFHEGDERRNHDGQPVLREGRELEAKRFTAPGRQQRKDILARQRILDDFFLQRAERSKTEVLLQQPQQTICLDFQPTQSRKDALDVQKIGGKTRPENYHPKPREPREKPERLRRIYARNAKSFRVFGLVRGEEMPI